jgi:hypothetical protein
MPPRLLAWRATDNDGPRFERAEVTYMAQDDGWKPLDLEKLG